MNENAPVPMFIDAPTADQKFYICTLGDGAIGYDGCGAIDFENSDLQRNVAASGPRMATRYSSQLKEIEETRHIRMRRAVRPFDFYYDYKFDTLLVSSKVWVDLQAWIEPSAKSLASVVCHFGKTEENYIFGNLRHVQCLDHCIWAMSKFATVDRRDFDINRTRIGRLELPLDHEVSYTARNQTFEDISDYRVSKSPLHVHVPEILTFAFPFQDILNIGIGTTLISERLFVALWSRHRPKSRVIGVTGSGPLVSVVFGAN